VYRLHAELKSDNIILLQVLASAGTYIKELVHGDLERTQPNIGIILGKELDILQLDVTQVYDSVESVEQQQDESWRQIDLS
jgi:tRNA pseudouridine synthase 10